ncbi:MAG: hypothetical protein GC178_07065 [Flavobacteriales bacterium]|nr:hypothetical protein [Flavobacteriales bacterium]
MKSPILTLFLLLTFLFGSAQTRTIHVFVALCDNANQGIVPVPASLGNGQDPKNNLYWGAAFGVKSFFKNKAPEWEFVKTLETGSPRVLERVLFKHKEKDVFLLADAYDGKFISTCIYQFLVASNGQNPVEISMENRTLKFGGASGLLAYIGHDGLMEFRLNPKFNQVEKPKDVIILACHSKHFFLDHIKNSGANPILWTTHLMAPEAYTLRSAIDGWLNGETGTQIDERAAQTYNQYQKCGIKGARNLFTTGF